MRIKNITPKACNKSLPVPFDRVIILLKERILLTSMNAKIIYTPNRSKKPILKIGSSLKSDGFVISSIILFVSNQIVYYVGYFRGPGAFVKGEFFLRRLNYEIYIAVIEK